MALMLLVFILFVIYHQPICAVDLSEYTLLETGLKMGAKNNNFGQLTFADTYLFVEEMLFVHVSGSVNCNTGAYANTLWGCHSIFGLFVTDCESNILYPNSSNVEGVTPSGTTFWKLENATVNDPQFLWTFTSLQTFIEGNSICFWYGEDFEDGSENDNGGTTFFDLYIKQDIQ